MKSIAIIGSGICGLSTAYTLVEKGYPVTIYAKDFPPETTSNRAAAFWFPYHIENDLRCIRWSQASYHKYLSLLDNPATGVSMRELQKVTKSSDAPATYWKDFIPAGSCRLMDKTEFPGEFQEGYTIQVPLMETQIFLFWLMDFLSQKGVKFVKDEIKEFSELIAKYSWVINCTGLGSRELCHDQSIYPIRGQVALMAPQKHMPIFLYEEQPFYIVPRKDATIIGGTFEENVWDTTPETATVQRLYQQATDLFPQLADCPVTGSWAGLRPYRKVIRVEQEAGQNIIHNYGHGGSGFTLAWGCAEDIAFMISN
ncbi:FAD-dependent oxidoreductase [Pontibacter anaerobius]|uniref:D-amino-acid oxidase n=1 Tax=Pontibacter anaerobius TaxID=2993940 RepID=A0ABT3RHV8_9BACT|nr:FAD-dependent oxidoreductase [Pontibacter anaerobius]MCX2740953.1 FAD-dependent oxidoreductase [Pontibacter anaerobius]